MIKRIRIEVKMYCDVNKICHIEISSYWIYVACVCCVFIVVAVTWYYSEIKKILLSRRRCTVCYCTLIPCVLVMSMFLFVNWNEMGKINRTKIITLLRTRDKHDKSVEYQREYDQWDVRVVTNHTQNKPPHMPITSTVEPPRLPQPPHIIFILADDLGWGDVGYHGSEIRTPVIDKLANDGIKLENYYAQATCTPTRASIMTGRYMSRSGLERVLFLTEAACLPTKYPTMPEHLQKNGYNTHLLGKWHLGSSRNECLPNQRGFDTFLGFHVGGERYFTHTQAMPMVTKPAEMIECYDFWENNNITYRHKGEYSTHVYTQRAQQIIQEHSQTKVPMFLFMSFQAVHGPLEVPDAYTVQYREINDTNRRLYAGISTCMDEGIGNITESLKQHGLWNNSVLIFSSDNGATYKDGGNNKPLKGRKGQYLEGGIRVPAFINSPLIEPSKRGSVFNGLIGASDWFPTLVEGIAKSNTLTNMGLDGVNMWDALRLNGKSPREEYLHAVGGNCEWDPEGHEDQRQLYGTLRSGDWKLKIGLIGQKAFFKNPESEQERKFMLHQSNLCFLYNIKDDPYEKKNLCKPKQEIVKTMLNRLREHCRNSEKYAPVVERNYANPKLHGGLILPWLKDGDELEWHGNQKDREEFLSIFIEI